MRLLGQAPQFLGVILTRLRPSSQAKAQAWNTHLAAGAFPVSCSRFPFHHSDLSHPSTFLDRLLGDSLKRKATPPQEARIGSRVSTGAVPPVPRAARGSVSCFIWPEAKWTHLGPRNLGPEFARSCLEVLACCKPFSVIPGPRRLRPPLRFKRAPSPVPNVPGLDSIRQIPLLLFFFFLLNISEGMTRWLPGSNAGRVGGSNSFLTFCLSASSVKQVSAREPALTPRVLRAQEGHFRHRWWPIGREGVQGRCSAAELPSKGCGWSAWLEPDDTLMIDFRGWSLDS